MRAKQEAWLKAGTGDDKTDILIIADAYDRGAIFSRDRNLTSNGNAIPFGGGDGRSSNKPGQVNTNTGNFFLNPNIAAPTPHSAANAQTSSQYLPLPGQNALAPLPGGHNSPFYNSNFFAFNFASSDTGDSRRGPSKLLWFVHPRSLRQVPDGVCGL